METSWQISRRQSIWTNITRSVRYTDIWEQNRKYPLHIILCVQQYLLILRACQSEGFWYFLNYWSVMEVRWQISRVQSIRIGELFLYRNVFMQCHKGSGMLRESIDDVLLRREFFFQRYMFLYMTKTSVHLHYTSLSMLDYSFADSTQDSLL